MRVRTIAMATGLLAAALALPLVLENMTGVSLDLVGNAEAHRPFCATGYQNNGGKASCAFGETTLPWPDYVTLV